MWAARGLIFLGVVGLALGLGFRYNYEPSTGHSALETHVPGSEPIVNWNTGVRNWYYGRNYDGKDSNNYNYFNGRPDYRQGNYYGERYDRNGRLLPYNSYYNDGRYNSYNGRRDREPRKFRNSDNRYTCEAGAYYSESQQRCFWNN